MNGSAVGGAVHPLFETFANFNDALAEHAVTLGAKAFGTVRHVAQTSRIDDTPKRPRGRPRPRRAVGERFESYLVELCA